MSEKKIIIQIDEVGKLNAETFGMFGAECIDEIDRIMKGIALEGMCQKKKEFYEQKSTVNSTVRNKYD